MNEKEAWKVEEGLRMFVDFLTEPEVSRYERFGPESLGELLAGMGKTQTKGLEITRTGPRLWEVARRNDTGYHKRYDPVFFAEQWLTRVCEGDQDLAAETIDELEYELDYSDDPEDGRRRKALRYLVDSAREAGVLEAPPGWDDGSFPAG